MQPRRSPVSRASSVTNAPRRSRAPATSGNSGSARPHSAASMKRRASASSAVRSVAESSGSAMVLLSAPNGVGAIELLVDNDAGELVRQRQRPETPLPLGAPQHVRRQTVMVANEESDVSTLHLPTADQLGEVLGAPCLAARDQ